MKRHVSGFSFPLSYQISPLPPGPGAGCGEKDLSLNKSLTKCHILLLHMCFNLGKQTKNNPICENHNKHRFIQNKGISC